MNYDQASDSKGRARPLVLVVDDEEPVRKALDRHLKKMGYDVIVTDDGARAIELAGSQSPAVILSDIYMPGMDGHTLLANLNRMGALSAVVLMSGRGELDDAISALREGAVDYMKKPWTPEGLTAVLSRAMGLAEAFQDLAAPATAGGGPPWASAGDQRRRQGDVVEAIERLAGLAGADLPLADVTPTLTRLRAASRDRERSLADVASFVETDPQMKAAILRMARAQPGFAPTSSDPLRAALEALGVGPAWACIEAASLREAFPIRTAALKTLSDRIWRFSVARAIAMQELAEIADAELELAPLLYFQAGLLLDAGASYLLSAADRVLAEGDGRAGDPVKLLAIVTTHHASVTARIMRRWNLPTALEELAAEHHGTGERDNPRRAAEPLWCAAELGGAMAVRVTGFGDPTGDRLLSTDRLARCAYTLGVGDTSLRRLTRSLTERATQTWAAFG